MTQTGKPERTRYSESSTAGFVTFFRACSYKERDQRFRGPDNLACLFHFGKDKLLLGLSFIILPLIKRTIPGTYEWVLTRTKYLDEQFKEALDENIDQIVNLGAGFDTRPIRFKDSIKDTVIYELDLPSPQRIKKEILKDRNLETPDNLRFVPIDFNTESLETKLTEAGFKEDKRCLYIWEGVTEYLTEEAVDSTLEFIRSHSQPGSRVAFTYIYREAIEGSRTYYGTEQIFRRVAKSGEPYQYGIPEEGIESFLDERGFRLLEHHTAEDLEQKYLTAPDGTRYGRICGHNSITLAKVN